MLSVWKQIEGMNEDIDVPHISNKFLIFMKHQFLKLNLPKKHFLLSLKGKWALTRIVRSTHERHIQCAQRDGLVHPAHDHTPLSLHDSFTRLAVQQRRTDVVVVAELNVFLVFGKLFVF